MADAHSFAGYVCWNPDTVHDTIAADIAAARDAAILLATHRSLPLARIVPPSADDPRRLDERESLGDADEAEILEAFLAATNDPLLVAVVGKSGSGKSHVVRWVYAHLQDRPKYKVIYVPRQGTNLRSVLRRILKELPGSEPAELLEALESATADISLDLASSMLLDQLANTLQFSPPPSDDPAIQGMRDRLVGQGQGAERQGGLPELLRFPSYRRHLLADNSVISALVDQTFGEGPSGQEEGYRRFEKADLRPRSLPRINALDESEKLVYERIVDPDKDAWADAAADLLNEALEEALTQILGLQGRVSLSEVMTRSRELLLEQGLELVLLVEDFALLEHRIDRQLLEALLVPSVPAPGERPRCRLRTMFAITDDPFDRLQETVRTRVGLLYRTGAPFGGQDGVDLEAATGFVGAYLNAARLGPDELIADFSRASLEERQSGAWVRNACTPCDFRARCHDPVEGFGTSGDGFGLYPYNRPALERALATVLRGGWFAARAVVDRIVGDVLSSDVAALRAGQFPSPSFAGRFPATEERPYISSEVSRAAAAYPDAKRREILLTFWGGAPNTLSDVGTHIHEAFAIQPVGIEPPPPPPPPPKVPPPNGGQPVPPPIPPIDDQLKRDLAAVDVWRAETGRALPDELIERLRARLHGLVMARVNWNDELLSPRLSVANEGGEVFSPQSFEIRPGSGRSAKASAVRFELLPTPDNAVLLKAVLRFLNRGAWEGTSDADDFLLVQEHLDRWAGEVLSACRTYGVRVTEWDPVPPALECLSLAAAVLGIPGAMSDDKASVVAAAVGPAPQGEPPQRVTEEWTELYLAAGSPAREDVRKLFVSWVQAAQADGAPLAIDLPRVVRVAGRFEATLSLSAVPAHAPMALRQWRLQLAHTLEAALQKQADQLIEVAERLEPLHGLDLDELAALFVEAGESARERGVFVEGDRIATFLAACRRLEEIDLPSLAPFRGLDPSLGGVRSSRFRNVLSLIALLPEAWKLIAILGQVRGHLDRSIARAESDLGNAPDLGSARQRLDRVLADLEAGVEAIA